MTRVRLAIAIFSTRCAIRSWRPIGLETSGGGEVGGGRRGPIGSAMFHRVLRGCFLAL
jgi:hypothetical protein